MWQVLVSKYVFLHGPLKCSDWLNADLETSIKQGELHRCHKMLVPWSDPIKIFRPQSLLALMRTVCALLAFRSDEHIHSRLSNIQMEYAKKEWNKWLRGLLTHYAFWRLFLGCCAACFLRSTSRRGSRSSGHTQGYDEFIWKLVSFVTNPIIVEQLR